MWGAETGKALHSFPVKSKTEYGEMPAEPGGWLAARREPRPPGKTDRTNRTVNQNPPRSDEPAIQIGELVPEFRAPNRSVLTLLR
jgi:hypothetical protein